MTISIERIEQAAETLEEVSRIYEYSNPQFGEWSASDLRNEIPALREHIEHSEITLEITREVSKLILDGKSVEEALNSVLKDYGLKRYQ